MNRSLKILNALLFALEQLALRGSRVVFLKRVYHIQRSLSFETILLSSSYNVTLVSSLLFLPRHELLIECV